MIHIAAISQIRLDTPGRAYFAQASGRQDQARSAALPHWRISDALYRQLLADAEGTQVANAGPGGHCGASQESSAVDLPPHIDTSDQPLPGPAKPTLQPPKPALKPSRPATRTTG